VKAKRICLSANGDIENRTPILTDRGADGAGWIGAGNPRGEESGDVVAEW
jgi:hypothetical protein